MAIGRGTLTDLERLKAEYAPKFKKEAPKRRKRGPLCFYFRCKHARLKESPVGLRLQGGYCKLKRCPRKQLEDYLWLLEKTRHWRQQRKWSSTFWWGTVIKKRDELRKVLT